MLDYSLFLFAAPPRTGTTWFLQAAWLAGLGLGDKSTIHDPFPGRCGTMFRVSIVRHPCDWLASYYASIHPGQIGVRCVDRFRALDTETFEAFIRSYLAKMPGAVGEMFSTYDADTYMKLEDMPWAFLELLKSMNVPDKLRYKCKDLGKRNASLDLPRWDRWLKKQVMQVERKYADAYEYI